jgi:D-3-phosphoglycerate dehydrogenase
MNRTYRILLSAPYMLPEYERFRPIFRALGLDVVRASVEERLSEEELLQYAGGVDGVICGDDRFSRRVLREFAPQLKVISKWGTGLDSIDRAAAEDLGVQVRNTPGAFTHAVADTVLGHVLSFARRIPWMDGDMKSGRWRKLPNPALRECSLGVVGVGDIGKAVLRRAGAFGMRLLGNDIVDVGQGIVEQTGVAMLPLPDLLSAADYVSLNPDLNPTSRHLINADTLAVMRESAVLINTSRGPVVDESALVDALRGGQIRGAALDVFEEEPLPLDSPLRGMENVLLSPHNANSSPAAWERVHWNTLRNLLIGLEARVEEPLKSEIEEKSSAPDEGE